MKTGCLLPLLGLVATLQAHTLNMTRVAATFSPGGQVAVKIDVDLSLVLGSSQAYADFIAASGPAQAAAARNYAAEMLKHIEFSADGTPLTLQLHDWKMPDVPPERVTETTIAVMTTLNYTCELPPGTQAFAVSTPMSARLEFPIAYTLSVPTENRIMTRWLELPGTRGRAFALAPVLSAPVATAASVESASATGASAIPTSAPAASTAAQAVTAVPAPPASAVTTASDVSPFALALATRIETAGQFLWLGFLHILPRGADHILFVLGLFFLGLHWRPLISQTTAFTVAHTTTLGLSAYGIFSLPSQVVEPLIALSIAYVAIENIVRPRLTPARIIVVFSFGLLHGLGFASSLSEVPMPREQFFTALLAFNFGVDFGQLAIIALAFLTVGWWRNRPWYRPRVVIPACALIAVVSLFWTVQRIFF